MKFTFNPFELAGVDPPSDTEDRQTAVSESADFILEQVLSDVGQSKSPLNNQRFTRLNKEYKSFKRAHGRPGVPNLEFSGAMLSAMKTNVRGNRITLQITGKQGDKADGHNNHSGRSSLPLRRFIPTEGESFRPGILEGIRRIVDALD